MRRILAVVIGFVGLWFLISGVLSLFGTGFGDPGSTPVPAMGTSGILGGILVVGALLLWRSGAHRRTG